MRVRIFNGLMLCVAVALLTLGLVGFSNRKINLYENMVNASVLIRNDYTFGSGVFIDDDVILTAAHVLRDANTFSVELIDGTVLDSNDFYIDEQEDVGFIFLEADELAIAKLRNQPGSIGDVIYLVGTPYDIEFKFTLIKGIISHISRDIPYQDWNDLLQVDADGGTGCSGGPLYNVDGRVIGMYVGQCSGGGKSISLCETTKSILEAYERCMDAHEE